ncbi:MAG: hypothetical protein ACREXY_05095, partial [Gammaproteobacteria bacterium]
MKRILKAFLGWGFTSLRRRRRSLEVRGRGPLAGQREEQDVRRGLPHGIEGQRSRETGQAIRMERQIDPASRKDAVHAPQRLVHAPVVLDAADQVAARVVDGNHRLLGREDDCGRFRGFLDLARVLDGPRPGRPS